jgi:uncharacterized protein (UPF0218 family)
MAIRYSLTPELRIKLKQPLGTLIRGSFNETMKRFRSLIEKENPSNIISVGDTVSRNLAENHFSLRLSIIDNRCMRKSTKTTVLRGEKTVYAKNPQGTITEEAILAIQDALRCNLHTVMVVDGEEDLLTLVAIVYAPENSFVVYGQPHEGIVAVRVTPEKKGEIEGILKAMEKASKS